MIELFNEIIDFNNKHFPNWKKSNDVYYSNAIAGEVGELCNMTKHNVGGGSKNKSHDIVELIEECSDIFIYLALFIAKNNVSALEFKNFISTKIKENYKRMKKKENDLLFG